MARQRYLIVGAGSFGSSVARELMRQGHEVIFLDKDANIVQKVSDEVTQAVVGDATDEDDLMAVGARQLDGAVVAIGSDLEVSILSTMLLKELGVPLVFSKATSDNHGRVLNRVGADRIIFPERDAGIRVARLLQAPTFLELGDMTAGLMFAEIRVGEKSAGMTLAKLDAQRRLGVTIASMRVISQDASPGVDARQVPNEVRTPDGAYQLKKGDILLAVGQRPQLEELQKIIG
ncbi:MAG: TrkA family potassium uptake protein [Verrucomicrobiota bacterium]|jgi:trk system potassium uptake protein TrkA|nr:TrkA family potassium uptake protein [Verrucomicrobiota bacterium]MDD8045058.1 TrkA family potassium uptake protein [Verrucomicrobiota bacterium]MDD8051353.1 TrkA family potassium uptake protein [Verrucomicrobiota bacterium]MDI9383050.1 TrkA family potassium uptake protein [Verrucomicrobiota bacterium]HCF94985.1 potassium uptake system protein [Verrucomicrobiota bacterium]